MIRCKDCDKFGSTVDDYCYECYPDTDERFWNILMGSQPRRPELFDGGAPVRPRKVGT